MGTPVKKDDKHLRRTFDSPGRRSLDFDYFNEEMEQRSPLKRAKPNDEPNGSNGLVKIASLTTGKYFKEELQFRVILLKSVEKERITAKAHIMDETGEISMTAFSDYSEEFLQKLRVGEVYKMVNFEVKPANPKYDAAAGHKYRILLSPNTTMDECEAELPQPKFSLEKLLRIEDKADEQTISTVVLVTKNWGMSGSEGKRYRFLSVVDETNRSRLTLFGHEADNFGDDEKIVIGLRDAVVGTYEGVKVLKSAYNTVCLKNYACDEATKVNEWFMQQDLEKSRKDEKRRQLEKEDNNL